MFSGIRTLVTFALALGLFLAAPAAEANTFKGSFVTRGESVSIFSDFSFDGSATNTASLNTFTGSDSLGDVGQGQGVSEFSVDVSTPCTFKGLFGNTESGVKLTLVGAISAFDASGGPLFGVTFAVGSTAPGCINLSNGDFSIKETDNFVGGTGGNRNATGSDTYTTVGVTLAAPSSPGYGFFSWSRSRGTFVETVP